MEQMTVDIQGRAMTSSHSSVSQASRMLTEFLQSDPISSNDDTLRRYLDTVAWDLQESAQEKRDGYAKQKLATKDHLKQRRRVRRKQRRANADTEKRGLDSNHIEDDEKSRKKKKKKTHE